MILHEIRQPGEQCSASPGPCYPSIPGCAPRMDPNLPGLTPAKGLLNRGAVAASSAQ